MLDGTIFFPPPASMTRMRQGGFVLDRDSKSFELAQLLVSADPACAAGPA